MNFFKFKTRWSNAEFIVFKLCIASAYILIGAYFGTFVLRFYIPFLSLFIVTGFWAVTLYLKKMKAWKH